MTLKQLDERMAELVSQLNDDTPVIVNFNSEVDGEVVAADIKDGKLVFFVLK